MPSAADAEHRVEMLRHYLRGRGLDEDLVIRRANSRAVRSRANPSRMSWFMLALARWVGVSIRRPGANLMRNFTELPARFSEPPALGTKAGEKRGSPVLSEQEFRSSPASDSASFFAMFPDAQDWPHVWQPAIDWQTRRRP